VFLYIFRKAHPLFFTRRGQRIAIILKPVTPTPVFRRHNIVKNLSAKITLVLLVLTTLALVPAQLRADGNPVPCNKKLCLPVPN
jgi:hypothetical protein